MSAAPLTLRPSLVSPEAICITLCGWRMPATQAKPKQLIGDDHERFPLFNLTGHPAVVLPLAKDRNGLPVGVQIVGRRWSEERLLAIAKTIASVTAGSQRPPGY
jgi:Asp-tRNA(Asn)/Glu-tRNA(Gln) amidotransferase A subunit family amidase